MKKILIYGICCLFLTFNSCQKDDLLPVAITEEARTVALVTQDICATQEKMDKNLQDPLFRKQHEARLAAIAKHENNGRAICDDPVIIPIAIHYQNISNPNIECLRALAQNQINILNADFQGSNSDLSLWDIAQETFPGITPGETCVRFCLADKNHPVGYNLEDGDPAVTVNQTSGDRNNDWENYVNVFVRNLRAGLLGYVQSIPGAGNGDGATISRNAFGSGIGCTGVTPSAPFHLGRTLTHEIGHFLNLRHIWGDGACGASDFVDDTPNASDNNSGCPNLGKSSCGSPDLHMNYMDYTNQDCMYMFTEGQSARMENALVAGFPNILSNAFNVCSLAPNPTCDDGIKNGNETGIDCGGSCIPCGQTCNNGFKDGDETGVDCGGSCPEVCPTGGGSPCLLTGKYASFAAENADQVRQIAKIISNTDDPALAALIKKLVRHQSEAITILEQMQNDDKASELLNSLLTQYRSADQSNLRITNQTSGDLIEYFKLVKTYTDSNSELNLLIDETIKLVK